MWPKGNDKVKIPYEAHDPIVLDNVIQFPDYHKYKSIFSVRLLIKLK